MYLSPPLFPLAAFFFTGPEAYRMIPIDILLSSRLYAPLAFSILILAWSIARVFGLSIEEVFQFPSK